MAVARGICSIDKSGVVSACGKQGRQRGRGLFCAAGYRLNLRGTGAARHWRQGRPAQRLPLPSIGRTATGCSCLSGGASAPRCRLSSAPALRCLRCRVESWRWFICLQLCRNARRQRCHAPALWHSCGRAAPSRAREESGSRNRRRSGFRCVCFGSWCWLVG